MSIEDERRCRVATTAAHPHRPSRREPRERAAYEERLERALAEVRAVGVEASELLRSEGLTPAKLVHVPHGARSWPLIGRALSGVVEGGGWHVVRGVVVGTDGRLWTRSPAGNPTPPSDLDAWRLRVEPPGGPLELPPSVQFDGTSLHVVRRIAEDVCTRAGLVDRLTDGYARLLILHHRRRS
ncbi:hypothetical protein AUQ48_02415 [Kocuria flava]|uniref:Uncharacterized protein n=1 Tax=Kocuria flava TaxID=446860 RepID=A0A2N4SZE8_9MICC|nr:hypothetical protein [Kocuria flava]PLC11309.1 hypothetical protein AUQ48_02415 [Kocuria flava]